MAEQKTKAQTNENIFEEALNKLMSDLADLNKKFDIDNKAPIQFDPIRDGNLKKLIKRVNIVALRAKLMIDNYNSWLGKPRLKSMFDEESKARTNGLTDPRDNITLKNNFYAFFESLDEIYYETPLLENNSEYRQTFLEICTLLSKFFESLTKTSNPFSFLNNSWLSYLIPSAQLTALNKYSAEIIKEHKAKCDTIIIFTKLIEFESTFISDLTQQNENITNKYDSLQKEILIKKQYEIEQALNELQHYNNEIENIISKFHELQNGLNSYRLPLDEKSATIIGKISRQLSTFTSTSKKYQTLFKEHQEHLKELESFTSELSKINSELSLSNDISYLRSNSYKPTAENILLSAEYLKSNKENLSVALVQIDNAINTIHTKLYHTNVILNKLNNLDTPNGKYGTKNIDSNDGNDFQEEPSEEQKLLEKSFNDNFEQKCKQIRQEALDNINKLIDTFNDEIGKLNTAKSELLTKLYLLESQEKQSNALINDNSSSNNLDTQINSKLNTEDRSSTAESQAQVAITDEYQPAETELTNISHNQDSIGDEVIQYFSDSNGIFELKETTKDLEDTNTLSESSSPAAISIEQEYINKSKQSTTNQNKEIIQDTIQKELADFENDLQQIENDLAGINDEQENTYQTQPQASNRLEELNTSELIPNSASTQQEEIKELNIKNNEQLLIKELEFYLTNLERDITTHEELIKKEELRLQVYQNLPFEYKSLEIITHELNANVIEVNPLLKQKITRPRLLRLSEELFFSFKPNGFYTKLKQIKFSHAKQELNDKFHNLYHRSYYNWQAIAGQNEKLENQKSQIEENIQLQTTRIDNQLNSCKELISRLDHDFGNLLTRFSIQPGDDINKIYDNSYLIELAENKLETYESNFLFIEQDLNESTNASKNLQNNNITQNIFHIKNNFSTLKSKINTFKNLDLATAKILVKNSTEIKDKLNALHSIYEAKFNKYWKYRQYNYLKAGTFLDFDGAQRQKNWKELMSALKNYTTVSSTENLITLEAHIKENLEKHTTGFFSNTSNDDLNLRGILNQLKSDITVIESNKANLAKPENNLPKNINEADNKPITPTYKK